MPSRFARSFARAEAFTLLGLSALLIAAAILREDFIGDGVRHIQPAISSSRPLLGQPRWLVFPALAWAIIHPLASVGLVTGVEPAIRTLVLATVASGIAYLSAIRLWLGAEGQNARTRMAALVLAASTMPFLVLYTDIAEVQVAAAAIVVALAVTRARRRHFLQARRKRWFASNRAGIDEVSSQVGAPCRSGRVDAQRCAACG